MDVRLIILFATAVLEVTGISLSILSESPVYIKENSSLELKCVFKSPGTNGYVTWYKDQVEVKSPDFTVMTHTGYEMPPDKPVIVVTTWTLTKTKVRNSDSGRYSCAVEKLERVVQIKVVKFQNTETTVIVPGNPLRVRCSVGSLAAEMTTHWSKDGVNLSALPMMLRRIVFKDHNTTLEINNSSHSDIGRYQCEMKPRQGEQQGKITHEVLVAGMPYFSDGNNNTESYYGVSGLALRCLASGYPAPNISWTKDNTDLVITDRHVLLPHKNITKAVMKFTHFLPEDIGFYSCEASNKHGSSKRNFEIFNVSSAHCLLFTRTLLVPVLLCLLTLFRDVH